MRAWDGKLAKVDKLLAWMYDKDILTAGEKRDKDRIFNAYYRYYNDGDLPSFLKSRGLTNKKWDKARVQQDLEEYLEAFMKKILSKYLPKIDRSEFRLDTFIKDMDTVIDVASRADAHALINYWIKTVKLSDDEVLLKKMVAELKDEYDDLLKMANDIDPGSYNTVMSYRMDKLAEQGKVTKELRAQWKVVKDMMAGITTLLKNLQTAAMNAKKQNIGEKA